MNTPLVVEIPHRLGKDEAVNRLKVGLSHASVQYGKLLQVHEEIWSGDKLSFRVEALRQMVAGTVDVRADNVRIEVELPWLLARLANAIQSAIRTSGTRMLEKKP